MNSEFDRASGNDAHVKRTPHRVRVGLVSVAAFALAACGSVPEETLEAVKQEAGAVAAESRVVEALDTAIDEKALEGLARGAIDGAVNEAIGEVVPAEGIATVRAIVDEEAIAKSLNEKLDKAAAEQATQESAPR
jgi:hypothetical protein